MAISPRNECFWLSFWPEDKSIRPEAESRMNAALEATSVPNQNGSTARPGRSFMPHMYMAFWFDMAKAFGKCNLQRSARSSDHFARTHIHSILYSPGELVNFGRSRSHQEPLNLKVERHRHHLPPISHRSHSHRFASESRSDWNPSSEKKETGARRRDKCDRDGNYPMIPIPKGTQRSSGRKVVLIHHSKIF